MLLLLKWSFIKRWFIDKTLWIYQRSKTALPDIKVTYADVWEYWLKNTLISKKVTDFVTIHILPYWEDDPMNIESIKHLADVGEWEVEGILKLQIF